MDMSHRWKCIYLITCFRQGFPGLKYTLNSVTQLQSCWQPLGIALLCSKQSQGRELWATAPPAEPRRLGACRCREKHHGATTRPLGAHKAPERASPREPAQAAAGSSSPCQKPLSKGLHQEPQCWERGLLTGLHRRFLCCHNSSCDEGLGLCVWGRGSGRKPFSQYLPRQTWQWVSPKRWCGTPGEGKEEL